MLKKRPKVPKETNQKHPQKPVFKEKKKPKTRKQFFMSKHEDQSSLHLVFQQNSSEEVSAAPTSSHLSQGDRYHQLWLVPPLSPRMTPANRDHEASCVTSLSSSSALCWPAPHCVAVDRGSSVSLPEWTGCSPPEKGRGANCKVFRRETGTSVVEEGVAIDA